MSTYFEMQWEYVTCPYTVCVMPCVDETLAYTTASGDVVQLNVKTNETSVIVDNATLVNDVVF